MKLKSFIDFVNEKRNNKNFLKELCEDFINRSVKVTGLNESDIESLRKCFIFKEGKLFIDLNTSPFEDGVCDTLKEMLESLLQRDPYNYCVKYSFNQGSGWCVWENK